MSVKSKDLKRVSMTWRAILARPYAMCSLGEEVVASLRRDLFRALLVQRVQFFDSHRAVRTHGHCSPRHQTHCVPLPSFLELNGML